MLLVKRTETPSFGTTGQTCRLTFDITCVRLVCTSLSLIKKAFAKCHAAGAICRSDRCSDAFLPIVTPVLSMYCNELTSICRLCLYQYWRADVSTLLPQCFHDNRDAYPIPLTVALFVQKLGRGRDCRLRIYESAATAL